MGYSRYDSVSSRAATMNYRSTHRLDDVSRAKWERDGSIMSSSGTEIDLCRRVGRSDKADWITVKGATDARCERLAERLLALLNDPRRTP